MPSSVIAVICHRRRTREKEARRQGGAGSWIHACDDIPAGESGNAALCDQRPFDKRSDLPHCYASDLRVPQSYKKAMSSEYSKLWEELFAREVCGLLDAGTFESVYRSIESYIHAKWVFNCKANKYGWLKNSKSRVEARGGMQKA